MGVHDLGFRGYDGERSSVAARVMAIAKSDVRRFFKNWKFLIYFVFSVTPAVIQMVLVYVWFVVLDEEMFRAGGRDLFESFMGATLEEPGFYLTVPLMLYMPLAIIFSGVVAGTIVSRDRRENALEIYFSRGIRPIHYFLGKWMAAMFMLLTQLLFPYVIVWIWAWMLSPDAAFFNATATMMPRVILAQLFFCGTLSFLAVAQSVSTSSSSYAVIRWVGGLFGLMIIAGLFMNMLDQSDWLLLSPWTNLANIAMQIAGAEAMGTMPSLQGTLIVSGLLVLLGAYWLRKHLRPVEVVG
jgi:ABC-type transport system involved in multi-copper enzyme maturation permease subunit